jgi:hypothetical protein
MPKPCTTLETHAWTHGTTPQPVSYGDLPLFAEVFP